MSKPTMVVSPANYVPNKDRDEYSVSVELKNFDPAECRMIVTMEKDGKEIPMEEIVELKPKVDLTLYDATTFHIYLFFGEGVKIFDDMVHYPNLKKKFKRMREFCESPDSDPDSDYSGCTITKETINVLLAGGRRRKSHPRSSGSKRHGSKRSGSKRSGSKRSGSKRHGGSRRRR
jgi:hypothetical protein